MNFANMVGENLSVVKMGESSIEFQQWFPLRKTPSIKSWYQPELLKD